ncbi:head-tail connector protein [Mycobacterium phage Anthony]|uniref:Head-to-tail connector protein n=1 Tax=Mycobacterium phage Anthony TaxID=2599857 RepID=A0A5J6THX8_9CAUD|nr:head-tail connector protein [Mycobacterium phage Anthony]QFG10390.1 hypothetical protein PBI_ANTHONY_18 [Mycobacterium phage Anthony]
MIVVGGRVIDPDRCNHAEDADPSECVCYHDWRVHWGNVDRQGS